MYRNIFAGLITIFLLIALPILIGHVINSTDDIWLNWLYGFAALLSVGTFIFLGITVYQMVKEGLE